MKYYKVFRYRRPFGCRYFFKCTALRCRVNCRICQNFILSYSASLYLCRKQTMIVLFHRCQNPQVPLYTPVVIIRNITSDHLYNLFPTRKALSIISFPFQNPPKAFHGAVVKTFGNSRHTLRHTCFFQLVVKHSACILKSSVTME